jgi:hypothetical protein
MSSNIFYGGNFLKGSDQDIKAMEANRFLK